MEVALVVDCRYHGEGPLWHPVEKCLYWLDIHRGQGFVYDPSSNTHHVVYEGEPVGGMTLQADGSLLFLMAKGVIANWRKGKLTTLTQIEGTYEQERCFNDAIADPMGRVYAGTLSPQDQSGRLYRINTDGTVVSLLENVKVSNGMAFSLDRKKLFYTETHAWKIHVFDYDQTVGSLTNQRTFTDIPQEEEEGVADGLTIDSQGYLWSARAYGSIVVRYSPNGTEERRIHIPTPKVTSLTFGGDNLDDLYVTTGIEQNKPTDPLAGALFKLKPGVRGVAEFVSRICL
jgi:D-xylonolactonase